MNGFDRDLGAHGNENFQKIGLLKNHLKIRHLPRVHPTVHHSSQVS